MGSQRNLQCPVCKNSYVMPWARDNCQKRCETNKTARLKWIAENPEKAKKLKIRS